MFEALRTESNPLHYSQLEALKKIHEKQIAEIQRDYREYRKVMETKITDLRSKNHALEIDLKDVINQLEKLKMRHEHSLKEQDYQRREFELKLKEMETEKDNIVRVLEEELGKLHAHYLLLSHFTCNSLHILNRNN